MSDDNQNPRELFQIEETYRRTIDAFQIEEILYRISFNDINETFEQASNRIHEIFDALLDKILALTNSRDKISINFFHDNLAIPISIPFIRADEINLSLIVDTFDNVIQSYKEETVNENNSFHARVQIQKIPQGSGRAFKINKLSKKEENAKYWEKNSTKTKKVKRLNTKSAKSNQIVKIPVKNDNFCAIRAVLTAISYLKKELPNKSNKKTDEIAKKNEKKLKIIVKKLNLEDRPITLVEIKRIEAYLKKYSISVINGDKGVIEKFYYKGVNLENFIYVILTNNHYDMIPSMKRFFSQKYYCDYCKKGANNLLKHYCKNTCFSCYSQKCVTIKKEKRKCLKCKTKTRNFKCMQRHNSFICEKKVDCKKCLMIKLKNHQCVGQKYCKNCTTTVNLDHLCYLKKDKYFDHESKFESYIFYDYECLQKNTINIPNLVVARKVCKNCLDKNEFCKEKCEIKVFHDNDSFCDWIFQQEYSICIAHNFKAYDGIFIQSNILKNITCRQTPPSIIKQGTKLLSLKYKKLKFIDSLSFIPIPLANFPKTFNIQEQTKGFFPFKFNTEENQNYIGKIPPKEDYGYNFMKEEKKIEFDLFYEKNKDKIFKFKEEFEAYCTSDVELLTRGCLEFRKIIINLTKVDPFRKNITIASLCHFIYRNFLLEEEKIAVIPDAGYNKNQITSKSAEFWLKFIIFSQDVELMHAKNGGEKQFDKIRVDGFDKKNCVIYEFHG